MSTQKEQRVIEVIANGQKAEATMNQISNAIKLLNSEIRKLPANSVEAKKKMAELAQLNTRFRDLNTEMRGLNKSSSMFWTQMKAGMIGVFGGNLLTNFMGAINSMTFGILRGSAQLEDLRADVRKTTGLTQQGIDELDKQLAQMDTRTARTELLQLAVEAGRLGIEGVENISQFVRAADKINIALGEDLGRDGLVAIGKLNDLFGKTKEMGIEKALESTGSAVNALAQKSTAAAPFIVDFTKQLGGTSQMAGQTLQNTMGLAATMDILGQRGETAATAMQQLFVGMLKDTNYWAGIAGLSVQDYTQLLNTDFNAALMAVLKGLNGNNAGLGDFAKKLDDANMDGTRAIGVISALAQNTSILATQQQISNEEFAKGTGIAAEAAIKQNNLAGAVDRLGKKWESLKNSTGAKDFMTSMVHILSALLDVVKASLPVLGALIKLVTIGAVAWGTYKVVVMASNLANSTFLTTLKTKVWFLNLERAALAAGALAQAVFTGNTARAAVAMNYFNNVVKVSPLGLFLSVLTAVGTAWYLFTDSANNAAQKAEAVNTALDNMGEVNRQAAESMKETTAEAKKMFDELSRTNTGTKERSSLISELNSKYGTHLQDLSNEAAFLRQIAAAEQEVINKIILKAQAEAAATKIKELSAKEMELQMRLDAINTKIAAGGNPIGLLMDRDKIEGQVNFIKDQYKILFDYQISKQKELQAAGGIFSGGGSAGGAGISSGGSTAEIKDKFKEDLKLESDKYLQSQVLAYQNAVDKKQTQAELNKALEDAQVAHLQRILEIEKTHNKSVEETTLALLKIQFEGMEKEVEITDNVIFANDKLYKTIDEQRQADLEKDKAAKAAKVEANNKMYDDMLDKAGKAQNIYNSFAQVRNQIAQNELDTFKNSQIVKEKDLKSRLDRGLITEAQYQSQIDVLHEQTAQREKEFKKEQFRRDKEAAIIRATIGTFEAAVSALKYDPTGILAAIVAGMGLAQVAAIAAQPVPEFALGGRTRVKGQSGQYYNADVYGSDWAGGRISGAGYIAGERGSELVVPNWLLTHPRFINTAAMLDQAIATRQFAAGGATGAMPQQGADNAALMQMIAANNQVMQKLSERLNEPFYGLAYFDEKKYNRRVANTEVVKEISKIM